MNSKEQWQTSKQSSSPDEWGLDQEEVEALLDLRRSKVFKVLRLKVLGSMRGLAQSELNRASDPVDLYRNQGRISMLDEIAQALDSLSPEGGK